MYKSSDVFQKHYRRGRRAAEETGTTALCFVKAIGPCRRFSRSPLRLRVLCGIAILANRGLAATLPNLRTGALGGRA
jgi:hypothetical protein